MILNLYGVRDIKMNDYLEVIALKKESVSNYLKTLVNDVKSPFFRQESSYQFILLGTIDSETGKIVSDSVLSAFECYNFEDFIDENIRNLQVITQTLNYLPNGYFKMPKEQQEHIQELIVNYAKEYVSNYLSNDTISQLKEHFDSENSDSKNKYPIDDSGTGDEKETLIEYFRD